MALAGLLGCTGAANLPAPLVEIPSAVTFPTSLDVDVDTIATRQAAAGLKAQVGNGPFSSLIFAGAELARTVFNLFVELSLRPLQELSVPVSTSIVQFEAAGGGSAPGTFKIDFSDYDFDGDGLNEGCAGCTCPAGCETDLCPGSVADPGRLLPICYRIWFQPEGESAFQRFIAGVFTRLPVRDDPATPEDEENPGNGSFRRATFELSPDEPSQLGAVYEHADPADVRNKSSQVALRTEFLFEDGSKASSLSNISISQVGLDNPLDPENLLKTVLATTRSLDDTGDEDVLQYRGRFREDADFFSGTVVNPGGEVPLFCAQISTGNASENPAACDELGISVEDLPFLPVALPSEVDLPAAFPLSPTF